MSTFSYTEARAASDRILAKMREGLLSRYPEGQRLGVARMILADADDYRDDVVREAAEFVLLSVETRSEEVWAAEAALSRLEVAGVYSGRAA